MNPVIKPSVINILGIAPTPVRMNTYQKEQQPQPELERRSFWNKFKGVAKRVAAVIVSALAVITPFMNAVSRFRGIYGNHRSQYQDNGLRAVA